MDIGDLGRPVDKNNLVYLDIPKPVTTGHQEITGEIVAVDRFGNLISNIDMEILGIEEKNRRSDFTVVVGHYPAMTISKCYRDVEIDHPLAIVGSRDCIEIAVNCGNAGEYFGLKKGDPVKVCRKS
jgi:S-adenosylmethionine hydrolase